MALRERLANRKRPTATFALRIEDDTAARVALVAAQDSKDPEAITAAQAAVDACYEVLHLTALSPADWEELVAQHPPTEQQKKADKWCNMDTFVPALLAACVAGEESEDEWADYLTKGSLTFGEAAALTTAVFQLNQRIPDSWYPKGSTMTRS